MICFHLHKVKCGRIWTQTAKIEQNCSIFPSLLKGLKCHHRLELRNLSQIKGSCPESLLIDLLSFSPVENENDLELDFKGFFSLLILVVEPLYLMNPTDATLASLSVLKYSKWPQVRLHFAYILISFLFFFVMSLVSSTRFQRHS